MTLPEFELRMRPEKRAGGFARDDGTIEFYTRIRSLLAPDALVLNIGAGRGQAGEDDNAFRANLVSLKGKVARVVGIDPDDAVLTNPMLDEAQVLERGKPLPFPDADFDLALCDWVLEHVDDVEDFAFEVHRVLKPGGWFCARTVNKFGYTGLAASLVGARLEKRVLSWAQPDRQDADIFPKRYKMNTMKKIRALFPAPHFENASYAYSPEPDYHGGNVYVYTLIDFYKRVVPSALGTCLFVFVKKRDV